MPLTYQVREEQYDVSSGQPDEKKVTRFCKTGRTKCSVSSNGASIDRGGERGGPPAFEGDQGFIKPVPQIPVTNGFKGKRRRLGEAGTNLDRRGGTFGYVHGKFR